MDLDLVERIEIIRGPSSALYGSNGVFATINVVTKSPVDQNLARVSTEIGSFGEKKVQVSSSTYLGKGANLLISTSAFNFGGRSVSFDEFNTPETSFGVAEGVDRGKGHHTFINLTWRDWSFTALASGRETHVPTGWYESIFNARGNRVKDGRSWVEALYSKDVGASGELRWRIHYDQYRYWGRYDYDYDVGVIEDNRDIGWGDWVGSRVSYGFAVPRLGTLTLGGEVNAEIRALQQNFDVQPEFYEYSSTDTPDRSYGVFVQQELKLTPQLTVYGGARFDDSKLNKPFVSPRVAMIYSPSSKTTYKLLYGQAFRNPNAFERYYQADVFNAPNPLLGPEKIDTVEATMEARASRSCPDSNFGDRSRP